MEEWPYIELSRGNDQKRKEAPYMVFSRDNGQNDAYISNGMQLHNHSLFSSTETNHFFQLPAFYLNHLLLTTLMLT